MEGILNNPIIVPLGAIVTVILIVCIVSIKKMRERELQAHHELRMREMEHARKQKEMEIEKAKLELGEGYYSLQQKRTGPTAGEAPTQTINTQEIKATHTVCAKRTDH